MKNLVNEINYLKKTLDTEAALREATETEFNQGIQNGPMRVAHDASILNVITAADALVKAAQGI
jgi:hypothetical protein